MASTGAVVYLRPRASAATSGRRATGAVMSIAIRTTTGQFSSGFGIAATQDLRGKKTFKPHRSVPVADASGVMTDAWTQYFDYVHRKFLNVDTGATLPSLELAITYSQVQSIVSEAVATALAQQTNNNAQTIAALRQLVMDAQIPGAQQIPPPQLAPAVVIPPAPPIIAPVDPPYDSTGGG